MKLSFAPYTLAVFVLAIALAGGDSSLLSGQDSDLHSKTIEISELSSEPEWRDSVDWLIDNRPYKAEAYRSQNADEFSLSNGLVRRTFRLSPAGATVAIDNISTSESLLRAVKPEAIVSINGKRFEVGGLKGQPNFAFLQPHWLEQMKADPDAMKLTSLTMGKPKARLKWKQTRHHAPDAVWPPKGKYVRMDYEPPESANLNVTVSVHYELYDGVPVFCKWISVQNDSNAAIKIDRFTSEILAVVEHANWVEKREGVDLPRPQSIHVETDFAFGGFNYENASRHTVHWQNDPEYTTQVNYLKQTPCLLVVQPTYGPAQTVPPGGNFESHRAFELIYDSTDRERRGLSLRKMYRTIAPWVTENPLMHHMRIAQPDLVKTAIDQAAEVGFEMVILSFGSGFNMENDSPVYLNLWKEIADYARQKNVEIGSYSLLSSRKIGDGNDIVSPEGTKPTHGNCPALTSEWGQAYFKKLYAFFEQTGFTLLEHDGSYPGDVDVTPRPPYQTGIDDSRWVQWRKISDFYKWCKATGIYLNVPDYYYLAGSNKCGMGYREVNWSLPRAMQVIHTRQNIYDGTWNKTPSMGWMFVPLSQYHGGGAAATIEPLEQHLDHYGRMIDSNLGLGVQACYRGPRLFDSATTRDMIKRKVDWFKRYRHILESDVIHGRRADGRDLDWMLHVNPNLEHKGMLLVYNPLDTPVNKTILVNLYYTGIDNSANLSNEDGNLTLELDRKYNVRIPVSVPAGSMNWYVIESNASAEHE